MIKLTVAFILGLFVATLQAMKPEPLDLSSSDCYGAYPRDEGEITINRLEPDGFGGLTLKTERVPKLASPVYQR